MISVATFGAGIAFATALETDAPQFTDPPRPVRSEISYTCVDTHETVPEVYRIHTERESMWRDQIRITEKGLIDIKTRSGINTPDVERERLARQNQLEARLQRLVGRLKVLREELERRRAEETKPIHPRVCY